MAASASVVVRNHEDLAISRHSSATGRLTQPHTECLFVCLDSDVLELHSGTKNDAIPWHGKRRAIIGGQNVERTTPSGSFSVHKILAPLKTLIRFEHSIDHIPTLSIRLSWTISDHANKSYTTSASIFYVPDNIIAPQEGDRMPTCSVIRIDDPTKLSSLQNYPGMTIALLKKLCSKSLYEIRISAHGRGDASKTYSQRMHLQGAEAKSYGGNTPLFRAASELIDYDHTVRILVTDSKTSDDAKKWLDKVARYREKSVFANWAPEGTTHYRGRRSDALPLAALPKYSLSPKVTYQDWQEVLLMETQAQLAELRCVKLLEHKILNLEARVHVLNSDKLHRVDEIRLLVDASSVERHWPRSAPQTTKDRAKHAMSLLKGRELEVGVFFKNLGSDSEMWSGIAEITPVRARDIILKLKTRSSVEDDRKRVTVNLHPIRASCSPTEAGAPRMEATSVDIHIYGNTCAEDRAYRQAERLYLEMSPQLGIVPHSPSRLETLFCASRFDKLPRIDIYEGVDEEIIDKLHDKLAGVPDQQYALDRARDAPGGIVLVCGFAGTGKTTLLASAVLPLYLQHKRNHNFKFKLLVASSLNNSCDVIADALGSTGMDVVRLFANSTEREIAKTGAGGKRDTIMDAAILVGRELIQSLIVAESVDNYVDDLSSLGLRDKNVVRRQLQNSLGWRILKVCGLVDGAPYPQLEERIDLRNTYMRLFFLLRDPDSRSIDEKKRLVETLDAQLTIVSASVLCDADAVVTTLALATEPRVTEVFKATHLVFEDAAKAQSLEVMGLLAFYPLAHVFMFGDPMQTLPVSQAKHRNSAFKSQLSLPLFTRLLINGFESVLLRDAVRFTDGLFMFLNEVFCESRMRMAVKKILYDAQDMVGIANRRRLRFRHPRESIPMHVFGMQLQNTQCVSDPNKCDSRYNWYSLANVWMLLEMTLDNSPGFEPSDIAILSSYRAQTECHDRVRFGIIADKLAGKATRFDKYTVDQLLQISISTVNTIPSTERDVVLYDVVATDRKAFVNEWEQCYTACSRAQQILYIIYDKALANACLHEGPFSKIGRYLRKHKLIFNLDGFMYKAKSRDMSKVYDASYYHDFKVRGPRTVSVPVNELSSSTAHGIKQLSRDLEL